MTIDSQLFKDYNEIYKKELFKELNLKSVMQVPRLQKIVINMGLGESVNDKNIIKEALDELEQITGQRAIKTFAKSSNASFKIRKGMVIGVKVTLRGQKMYDFLYKLINIGLPRIRDFRGINPKSFDGRGNFSLGIREFIIFPEINLDKVRKMKGFDISIITSTNSDNDAYHLLQKMGMPFKSEGNPFNKNATTDEGEN